MVAGRFCLEVEIASRIALSRQVGVDLGMEVGVDLGIEVEVDLGKAVGVG